MLISPPNVLDLTKTWNPATNNSAFWGDSLGVLGFESKYLPLEGLLYCRHLQAGIHLAVYLCHH